MLAVPSKSPFNKDKEDVQQSEQIEGYVEFVLSPKSQHDFPSLNISHWNQSQEERKIT